MLLASFFVLDAKSQTTRKSDKTVSVVGPPPENPTASCLDIYQTNAQGIWDLMTVGLAACARANELEPNADDWIECNRIVTDSYFAMHAVIDAAYDRCRGVNN